MGEGVDSSTSGHTLSTGSCEHNNECSGSIKGGQFAYYMCGCALM
jgi:hypothetical protein